MRIVRKLGTVAAFLVIFAFLPGGSAEPLAAYDLVGEDPKGDMVFPLATGVNYPACGTGFGCDKYDILSLEMADAGGDLHVKLNVGASYAGTSMIIYAVHFKVGGTPYFVCWNMNSAGLTTNYQDIQENTLACSRFDAETQVGPATKATGVETATDAGGRVYVLWVVNKATIPELGPGVPLTDVVAEIWARGPSTCCAGDDVPAKYLFNQADRAPDAESWIYAPGAGAPVVSEPLLSLDVSDDALEIPSGGSATVNVTVSNMGDEGATVELSAANVSEGLEISFDPSSLQIEAGANSTSNLTINATAEEGTQGNFTLVATMGDVVLEIPMTVNVTKPEPTPTAPPTTTKTSATTTSETGASLATETDDEGFAIPGPESALLVGALAGLVVVVRRRRP